MTIYRFKDGAHLKGDAQAIGERLDSIRARPAGLTPEAVVEDARPQASPLHAQFEWDDAKAAERFRLGQAGHLIRCVTVVMDTQASRPAESQVTVRAFVPVLRTDGAAVYESTATALSDGDYRRQVLERAHHELVAVTRKHRELEELAEVVSAIERVGQLLEGSAATA